MDTKLENARDLFYKHNYDGAKKIFLELNETYEAGFCSFLSGDLKEARELFKKKENSCTASSFGLIILDIIENKKPNGVQYFQVRSFLEIYLNLLIENKLFDWAQKIIDKYEYFMQTNLETAKFIARVLYANNYFAGVHTFANIAYRVCFYDAEIHYIDAHVYMIEKNFEEAKKCIQNCLSFASEYFPIIKLQKKLEELNKN